MGDDSGPIVVTTDDGEAEEATPAPNRYRAQLDEFSECVLTGKAPEFPAEDGLANTAALVALYASAASGAAVAVEQI